ncbi:hypothetical protein OROGR_001140 [Orobanche gracilis]
MSKKKATMSLKDFHGGSILSDLRLPSAPGVTMRPVDRPGFDRQMSWGNSSGRPDHRIRPASAGSVRRLDEKTPFLSHSLHICRNFDEDERKPLDGMPGPRRSIVDDETLRAQPSLTVAQPKVDNLSGATVDSRAASIPSPQSGSAASSYAGRVSEIHNSTRLNNQTCIGNWSYGSNYPVMGGNAGQTVGGSNSNAWGIRKEAAGMKAPVAWSAPDSKTKLAHASALEKVSSGRWNSKQHVPSPKDAEGESRYDANSLCNKRISNRPESVGVPEYCDVSLMMHGERSLAVGDGIHGGAREVLGYDRAPSIVRVNSYDRNTTVNVNGLESIMPLESSERPKLKLLPRSKPLENIEPLTNYKQTSNHLHVEDSYVVHEPKNPLQSGTAELMVGDRSAERPKLNLKPRSQTLEHPEGNNESKRGTVFGGARPRELVLKERGIEDDVSSYESHSPLRVKESTPKADTFTHAPTARYHGKSETNVTDQRTAKHYSDRRDHQMDVEKIDSHRRNNRPNEIRRNNWDVENKNCSQQQKLDRPPSPDTWRRPAEPDAPPMRHGKVATALELAQAFSKSVSDPEIINRFSGSRGVPGRGQVPFSRLTGPSPMPQVNGY